MKNCPKCKADLRVYAAEGADINKPVEEEVKLEEKVPVETPAAATVPAPAAPTQPAVPASAQAPAPQTATPVPASQPAAATATPASAAPTAAAPQTTEAVSTETTPMTITAKAPPTPEEEALQRTKENVLFGQDLSLGHIKTETYKSLYDKKDTLGKMGTIFGLLLSGAGSGLTGQPNALLAMMDKQIENDLEAQKTNQTNKQNWYKLSYEHTRNQVLNNLTNSEAYLNATEAEKQQMLNDAMGVKNKEISTNSKNMARLGYIQDQQTIIDKMPPGPARDKAQQTLNGVIQLAHKQMYNEHLQDINEERQKEAKKAAGTKTNMAPVKEFAKPGVHYDVVNQNKLNEGLRLGTMWGADAGKVPGAIPQEYHGAIKTEQKDLAENRNNWADAEDAFQKLAALNHAGQLPGVGALAPASAVLSGVLGGIFSGGLGTAVAAGLGHLGGAKAGESLKDFFERERQTQVNALVQRLRNKGMSGEEAKDQAEAILPKWNDNEKTLPEVHYQLQQHFKAGEDNKTPTLTQFGLVAPQPKYKYVAPKIEAPKEDKRPKPMDIPPPANNAKSPGSDFKLPMLGERN